MIWSRNYNWQTPYSIYRREMRIQYVWFKILYWGKQKQFLNYRLTRVTVIISRKSFGFRFLWFLFKFASTSIVSPAFTVTTRVLSTWILLLLLILILIFFQCILYTLPRSTFCTRSIRIANIWQIFFVTITSQSFILPFLFLFFYPTLQNSINSSSQPMSRDIPIALFA